MRLITVAVCLAFAFASLTACGDPDPNVAACDAWSNARDAFNAAMEGGIQDGVMSPEQDTAYDALVKSVEDGMDSTTDVVRNAFELTSKVYDDPDATNDDYAGSIRVLGASCVSAGAEVS